MTVLNAILINAYAAASALPANAAAAAPAQPAADGPFWPDDEKDQFQPGQYWKNRAAAGKSTNAAPNGNRVAQAYSSQNNLVFAFGSGGEGKQQGQAIATGADPAADALERQGGAAANSAASKSTPSGAKGPDGKPLSQQQVAQLLKLKTIDTEVRAHEQAHLAAAGGLAKGGPGFVYQKGPDGREYAVGGEVQIDTSKGATPAETMARMAQVRAAALAPANPSAQDLKVARAASAAMAEASLELQAAVFSNRGQQHKEAGTAQEHEQATGAVDNSSAVSPNRNHSAKTVRAASRYLAVAKDAGVFHRMV